MKELIDKLGDSFRGLWKSYYLPDEDIPPSLKWTVTFIYKGQYCETPNMDTPEQALQFAIKKNGGI